MPPKKQAPRSEAKTGRPPPVTTVPWGRAASEHRPGLFIKSYLQEHGEASAADIFYAMSENIVRINTERAKSVPPEPPLRRPNYSSFARYFHWFKILGLVRPTGKKEAAVYAFLKEKQFYQLTAEGMAEVQAWADPIAQAHPELR